MKKLLEHFTKRKSQKINQTEFKVEKAIKSYNNKVRLKRKGYKNSFNGWIDKKRHSIVIIVVIIII